ncbi:hypothetical protein SKAU_G00119650 [Synaphobranchus kaupii]|uniref:Uncharacterized protein n=1 Tax=Synaphobranchus kaupii TaxID=118154 RepID=A0A9Q1FNL4_SYNKA|nr:hypothetical protein SKAU_G00119650 [Synaphobranchus kaupii]
MGLPGSRQLAGSFPKIYSQTSCERDHGIAGKETAEIWEHLGSMIRDGEIGRDKGSCVLTAITPHISHPHPARPSKGWEVNTHNHLAAKFNKNKSGRESGTHREAGDTPRLEEPLPGSRNPRDESRKRRGEADSRLEPPGRDFSHAEPQNPSSHLTHFQQAKNYRLTLRRLQGAASRATLRLS